MIQKRTNCGAVVLCSALGFALTGCTSGSLLNDVAQLKRDVSDLRAIQADQNSRHAALESRVRELSGRNEELQFVIEKRLGSDLDTLRRDLSVIKQRVPPPPVVPVEFLEQDESRLGTLDPQVATTYGAALAALREGRFPDAEAALSELVNVAQGRELAADVLFWSGIAREGMADKRGAIQSYHALVVQYGKDDKVPAALLREGQLLLVIGDAKAAKLALNKLATDYPKSKEAATAREKLKALK